MPQQIESNALVQALAVAILIIMMLVTLSSVFVKKMVTKVLETVDRVPNKDWFERVEKSLKELPDLMSLSNRVHTLESQIVDLKIFEASARSQLRELDRRKLHDAGAA